MIGFGLSIIFLLLLRLLKEFGKKFFRMLRIDVVKFRILVCD